MAVNRMRDFSSLWYALLGSLTDGTTQTTPQLALDVDGVRVRAMTIVLLAGERPRPIGGRLPGFVPDRSTTVVGREPGDDGVRVDDDQISRRHFEVRGGRGGAVTIRDLGSHNGTFVDGRRIDSVEITPGAVIRAGGTLLVFGEVEIPPGMDAPQPAAGSSLARAHAEYLIDLAAPTSTPILVVGPTGAGKERLIERLHTGSGRSGRLVAVNCATFNRELLGSELFGHVKGAFSGADTARAGLIASADGGTLFLDEIADLPADQQAALLRVVQDGVVRPVGADREIEVDVRFAAATHADLQSRADSGAFRSDLYARLAGLTIDLPGLADRTEEILSLFAELSNRPRSLTVAAAEALLLYDWPRNVRELASCAKHVELFARSVDRVDVAHLPTPVRDALRTVALEPAPRSSKPVEGAPSREELAALLAKYEGSIASVARAAGKHRQQVYRWLKSYGLDAESYRES